MNMNTITACTQQVVTSCSANCDVMQCFVGGRTGLHAFCRMFWYLCYSTPSATHPVLMSAGSKQPDIQTCKGTLQWFGMDSSPWSLRNGAPTSNQISSSGCHGAETAIVAAVAISLLQGVALRCVPCGALLLNAQAYRTHLGSKVSQALQYSCTTTAVHQQYSSSL